uniref:Uncharacterized protein n=1 Tax=Lactuca sativa TaxID=4236 RepID=A0A9R1UFP1_LACSA|nr:hypothetical protein LSAT_V11C900500790 [Lactuca sativa]
MAWRGSISRTLMSATRNSSFRSTPPPLPRLRPPQDLGRIRMCSISDADGCRSSADVSPHCQCARVLRAVSWYLLPLLSGSLVVSFLLFLGHASNTYHHLLLHSNLPE